MSKILLQTTIPANRDDWDISRFSLLAAELRAAGHDVVARNRACHCDDPVLSQLDEYGFDQLWLLAELPFRRQWRLPAGVRRRVGARAAAHEADR